MRAAGLGSGPWLTFVVGLLAVAAQAAVPTLPGDGAIAARAGQLLSATGAHGLGVAVVDHGIVVSAQAFGIRDAQGDPLRTDTIMYGASLTKKVFAYTVLHLVDEGKLKLDTPLAADLDQPLPSYPPDPVFPDKYGPYADLAGDPRWQAITPRMCLNHSTGFSNFSFFEPDRKLRIHFQPGSAFSYSGEGFILLQFVVEHGRRAQGLGVDVGELTHGIFQQLGMKRTSLTFLNGSDPNVADGWDDRGQPQRHDNRRKVRAAGSMNTTVADMGRFAAALVRGAGLSPAADAELTRPVLHIGTATEFPLFQPELPAARQRPDLYAGLGVVTFSGPQGRGFFKGGHDGQTANTLVCLPQIQRAVVILSNDVRSEAGFAELVRFILGETGVPYDWEYGDRAGRS